jgi:hypothetical protein
VLVVEAVPGGADHPDAFDPRRLAPWLTVVRGDADTEHLLLSDGRHRIRLDVAAGSIARQAPVILHYRLAGLRSADAGVLTLRRWLHLVRHGAFAASLFPRDRRMAHLVLVLRAHDADVSGASAQEIALTLFGTDAKGSPWESSALRSRVRRLVADARAMACGGYRSLLRSGIARP